MVTLHSAADLDAAVIVQIACQSGTVTLGQELLDQLDATRERMLAALATGPAVYGVTTGMGALSERRLDPLEQAGHQQALLLARSAGGPPWLAADEVRAVLATRLRSLLNDDSGVSSQLCRQIVALINADVLPAVPRTGSGSAGEIIGLAHLASPLTGNGEILDAAGSAAPAEAFLAAAGLPAYELGPKEGIALIEGVPVTTALAILYGHRARTALQQSTVVLAAELALTHAARDSLDPAVHRGDEVLNRVAAQLLEMAGPEQRPQALQPPVSFRVSPQILAHLDRSLSQLDLAVTRALDAVSDSPAFVDGRFVGTAGFGGYDLAAFLHLATVAVLSAAESGAARLHRLLDPRVSGLNPQLSAEPGPHTGLTPVHKRAVGVVHALRRLALPATSGTVETSGGQEDAQSFSLEAADALRLAVAGLHEVVACERLAVHQMQVLGAQPPADAGPEVSGLLAALAQALPDTAYDRPWGRDLSMLLSLPLD